MLYLIPEKQKKLILSKYYGNIFYFFIYFAFTIALVFCLLMTPTVLMLRSDEEINKNTIESLKSEIEKVKKENPEQLINTLTQKIDLLKNKQGSQSGVKIYEDIKKMIDETDGISFIGIKVDLLKKKVELQTIARDKDSAQKFFETLQKSKYRGSELSYSIFTQKSAFPFNQNLNYE